MESINVKKINVDKADYTEQKKAYFKLLTENQNSR